MTTIGTAAALVALAVVAAAAGYGMSALWPRRRLFTTATVGLSVIPPGARPVPGDAECVELGHDRLDWSERISFAWLPWRGRRNEIGQATCCECGRPQTRLRVVYPPGYTITLDANAPMAATDAGPDAGPVATGLHPGAVEAP